MNRFDLDRGMGIRGLAGSKPPSFQYREDPVLEAISLRKDANNSRNMATDQYEADVADFKDTLAKEKEQGIAGLFNDSVPSNYPSNTYNPPMGGTDFRDDMINMPPPIENRPPFIAELPPTIFDDNPFKNIFEPPLDIPIDAPPFTPPIDIPPPGYKPPGRQPYEPPYDDRIDEDPPYVPPNDPPEDPPEDPPPPPPPPPSGPINYYTGDVINNPYTPYATDSGATPLTKAINPRSFGRAPGMFPTPVPIVKMPRIPDKPDELNISDNPITVANQGKYLSNSKLNKGIMRLPQSEQGDTMTTQMFQRAFRPRR